MAEAPPDELVRFVKAAGKAYDAMWKAFAEEYPEVTTGDFGPAETDRLDTTIMGSLQLWLFYNLEDRELAGRVTNWRTEYLSPDTYDPPHVPEAAWK